MKKSSAAQRANNNKIAYYRIFSFRDLPLGLRAVLVVIFSCFSFFFFFFALLCHRVLCILFSFFHYCRNIIALPLSSSTSLMLHSPQHKCCAVLFCIYRLLFTYATNFFRKKTTVIITIWKRMVLAFQYTTTKREEWKKKS